MSIGIVTWPLLVTRISPPSSITYYGNTLADTPRVSHSQNAPADVKRYGRRARPLKATSRLSRVREPSKLKHRSDLHCYRPPEKARRVQKQPIIGGGTFGGISVASSHEPP